MRSLCSLSPSLIPGFGHFHRFAIIFSSCWLFHQPSSFLGSEPSLEVYFNASEPHCLPSPWPIESSAPLISLCFWSSAFFGQFPKLSLASSLFPGWMVYLAESIAKQGWNKDCDTVLPWTWHLVHIAVPLETNTEARSISQMSTSPWCSALG